MIVIALGSNRAGEWGEPAQVLKRATEFIGNFPATAISRQSGLYETAGVGPGQPGNFVNAVVAIECHCGPEALLHRLKAIEHAAGPRSAVRWGPRTLDLDILDYRGRVLNWPARHTRSRAALVLPHPLLHMRPFVLAPLDEILPDWKHPVLRLSARQLWQRVQRERTGRVLRRL